MERGRRTANSARVRSENTIYGGTCSSRAMEVRIALSLARRRCSSSPSARSSDGWDLSADFDGRRPRGSTDSGVERRLLALGEASRLFAGGRIAATPRQLSHPSQLDRAAGSPKYLSTNPRRQSFV